MRKIIRNKNIRFSYTREIEKNETFYLFLYNPENGKDYVLNRFSALIWEMIQDSIVEEDLINILIKKLEIKDKDIFKKEVNKIVRILIKHNLIILENNEVNHEILL